MIRLRKLGFALILVSILQGCQNRYDELDQAFESYEANLYDQALENLQRIKDGKRQTLLVYKEASLLEGQIFGELDSLMKAEKSYKETLINESKLNRLVRNLKKRLLNLDPKLRIEYEANLNLARLLYDQGRYQESIAFLQGADQKQGFFGCGLGIIEEQFRRDTLLVSNYLKLGLIEPALERLGGDIFKEQDSLRVKEISDLLKEEYSELEVKNSLFRALTSIKRKQEVDDLYLAEYSTIWFGEEVSIQDIEIYDSEIGIDSIIGKSYLMSMGEGESIELYKEKIRESDIYKELEK